MLDSGSLSGAVNAGGALSPVVFVPPARLGIAGVSVHTHTHTHTYTHIHTHTHTHTHVHVHVHIDIHTHWRGERFPASAVPLSGGRCSVSNPLPLPVGVTVGRRGFPRIHGGIARVVWVVVEWKVENREGRRWWVLFPFLSLSLNPLGEWREDAHSGGLTGPEEVDPNRLSFRALGVSGSRCFVRMLNESLGSRSWAHVAPELSPLSSESLFKSNPITEINYTVRVGWRLQRPLTQSDPRWHPKASRTTACACFFLLLYFIHGGTARPKLTFI